MGSSDAESGVVVSNQPHHTPTAPLVHLVRQTLHGGRSLEKRVRLLRRRRRKGQAAQATTPTTQEVTL